MHSLPQEVALHNFCSYDIHSGGVISLVVHICCPDLLALKLRAGCFGSACFSTTTAKPTVCSHRFPFIAKKKCVMLVTVSGV